MKRFITLLTLSLLLASVYGLIGGAQLPASTSQGSWELLQPSPVATMGHAVVWAIHDGGLWSIGGFTANGATQRYDPATDTWTTHAVEPEPRIERPADGCYGLDGNGHEVVVLFPTTPGGDLHIYNITLDEWLVRAPSPNFPADGLTGHDVVSLYNVTGENVCYISGGLSGASYLTDLWEFRPDTRQLGNLGNFTHITTGFRSHASWYIPWGDEKGSICVGGGQDGVGNIRDETQCYDIAGESFGDPNSMGRLPEPRAYMADGWKIHEGRYQIWLANGLGEDNQPLQTSAYFDSQVGQFVYGPAPSVALFNTEGDGYLGDFYVEQGASPDTGIPSTDNLHLVQPSEPPCDPEVILFEDFEGNFDLWSMTGLWNPESEGDACGPHAAPFPSSDTAFYYGRDVMCDYDTGSTTTGELVYLLSIDLTYHTSATLTFWSYEETECLGGQGNCSVDLRFAEISTDWGITWNPIWGSSGPQGEWYQVRASLAPYAGKTVFLRFRFDSVDDILNDAFGWMVDDITVTACRSCQHRWHSEPRVPEDLGEDSAVLEYGNILLILGGTESGGESYRYSPGLNRWIELAPMSPEIEHPGDGAVGVTPDGPRAFILSDPLSLPSGAMVYDILTDEWILDPGFPVSTRNGHDMAEDRDHNRIYITGGYKSGMLDELWVYDPWDGSATQGPAFTEPRFHHASWYVPWLGMEGYLCIAGGTGEMGGVAQGYSLDSTQCYDIAQGAWRAENADLGPLPEPWTSMGDAVKVHNGCPQLWIVGGIIGSEPTTRTHYYDLCDSQWHWGEDLQYPSIYRNEAEAMPALGEIYAFPLGPFTQHHLQPCSNCQLITTADFTWTPPYPAINRNITLTGSSNGGGLVTFDWDLGDGTKARGPSITHTYVATGTYSVVMTASNPCSVVGVTATHDVTVGSGQYRLYVPLVVRQSP